MLHRLEKGGALAEARGFPSARAQLSGVNGPLSMQAGDDCGLSDVCACSCACACPEDPRDNGEVDGAAAGMGCCADAAAGKSLRTVTLSLDKLKRSRL